MLNKLLSFVPGPYLILIIVGLFAATFGVGYMKGSEKSATKIDQYEQNVLEQGHKITNGQIVVNDKIVTKYQDRIKIVYRTKENNDDTIQNIVPKSDSQFATGWVYVHNAAARGEDADPTRAADASPSGVTPNPALRVIADNYGTCQETREQLISLQDWVTESTKNIDNANKKKNK